MRLLLRWAVLAFAIWVSSALLPGIHVTGGAVSYFWIALIFGLVNAVIGNVIKILTFPITLLTLGLFMIVINGAMFALTDHWSTSLSIDSYWSALLGALVVSIVGTLLKKSFERNG